jgi:hypothetical protein
MAAEQHGEVNAHAVVLQGPTGKHRHVAERTAIGSTRRRAIPTASSQADGMSTTL